MATWDRLVGCEGYGHMEQQMGDRSTTKSINQKDMAERSHEQTNSGQNSGRDCCCSQYCLFSYACDSGLVQGLVKPRLFTFS